MNEKIITLKNLRIIAEYIKRKISGKANTDHTHTVSTISSNGFMSKYDKTKLDGLNGFTLK